jgi:hypothetical protein
MKFSLAFVLFSCSDYNINSKSKVNPENSSETDTSEDTIPAKDTGKSIDTGFDDSGGDSIETGEEPVEDTDSDTLEDTAVEDTEGETTEVIEPKEDDCLLAETIFGWLDQFQVPNDGKVYFCHSGTGGSYTIVNSDISSCQAHTSHPYDKFPTTICDS